MFKIHVLCIVLLGLTWVCQILFAEQMYYESLNIYGKMSTPHNKRCDSLNNQCRKSTEFKFWVSLFCSLSDKFHWKRYKFIFSCPKFWKIAEKTGLSSIGWQPVQKKGTTLLLLPRRQGNQQIIKKWHLFLSTIITFEFHVSIFDCSCLNPLFFSRFIFLPFE